LDIVDITTMIHDDDDDNNNNNNSTHTNNDKTNQAANDPNKTSVWDTIYKTNNNHNNNKKNSTDRTMNDENDFSIGFGVIDNEENDETTIAEIVQSRPPPKSKSSSSASASDKSSIGNDDDVDDDVDDDDATSTTEDSPTTTRQSSSSYSYNWRYYMPSHSNRWHFFRWLMVGGSVFAETQSDSELQRSLQGLALCLLRMRLYLDEFGMPIQGGPRDQDYVLREAVRDLYAGGTPLWALESVMQKAAEGLTVRWGHRCDNIV
jgi:hypothetical protein